MLVDTWHHLMLQRLCLGVQRLCLYASLDAIMAPLVFHTTVASVAEFCILREAATISESHDHQFDKA